MMLLASAVLLSPLLAGSAGPEPITISLAHDKPAERQTKAQLERLLATYDLEHWTFTRTLMIDEDAIPHSHPVLTLHTRHLKDDDLMVSTYIHEQMHWFLSQHRQKSDAAFADLRAKYPKIPVGFPEGSNDERGNYEHLAVVYLEYRADRQLLGELRAREVMEFWSHDHYTWIYRTVLEQARDIGEILLKQGLLL
jgi:hypothetical protein